MDTSDVLRYIVPGPVWHDHCDHRDGIYVATYEPIILGPSGPKRMQVDLYVFDGSMGRQEVCLRFGGDGQDYFSPGTVVDMAQSAPLMQEYSMALAILKAKGKIVWSPNVTGESK